jgi:RNA-splicing ligase RtcB
MAFLALRLSRCRQHGEWIGAPVQRLSEINCHHNYTSREQHFGKNVWLSRKGAIDAGVGVEGLIPGSMGAASYVVAGKGRHRVWLWSGSQRVSFSLRHAHLTREF